MRNKKLIPFEVIQKAVTGEPEAIDAVLRRRKACSMGWKSNRPDSSSRK